MAKQRVVKQLENPFSTGENFAELLKETDDQVFPKEGNIIKGKVVGIEKDNVIVDIGFKTEGRVQLREFPQDEQGNIQAGSEVEVYLERTESSRSGAVISRERALREESWGKMEKAHSSGESVKGTITSKIKGGFVVNLGSATAFLPGSQVDIRPVRDISPLMNIEQPFQILKMDRKRGNIVVSRRAILEESYSAERADALSDIKEGDIVDGVVKNITDYGAFVDLGAVDGLLHVTDISWQRVSHPSEALKVGEKLRLKVIRFDRKSNRISLGIKQLEENPWDAVKDKFIVDTIHKGKVTNITDYGAFVEIAPGVEGLVHVSEMSWTKKTFQPGKIVSLDQEVDVKILSVDQDKQRLGLGIKQCLENPWEKFAETHKVGDTFDGEISSIADFGLFIGLDKDVDGLVHVSDLSWDAKPEKALKEYNKGDKVKVKILEIDPAKERIALGVKQLQDKPEGESGGLARGSVATFTVANIKETGIDVDVSDGVTSFIKRSDLSRDKIDCRPDKFSVGDRVDAKVVSIDKKTGAVKLSIRALEEDEQRQAIEEFGSADSGATLGNILGVALDSAKKEKSAESAAESKEGKPKKAKADSSKKEAKKEESEEKAKPAAKKPSAKKATGKKAEDKADSEDKAEAKKPAAKKSTAKKSTKEEK